MYIVNILFYFINQMSVSLDIGRLIIHTKTHIKIRKINVCRLYYYNN